MNMAVLAEQLENLKCWFSEPSAGTRILREELRGLTGILQVSYNKKPNTFTAAYAVKNDKFDQIVHAKKVRGGGILVVQCGFVARPFHQVVGYPERPETLSRLLRTMAAESGIFFSAMSELQKVYEELGAEAPQFPFADPRARSQRHLFRAVIAALLGKEWREELKLAFDRFPAGISREWFDDVATRLNRFDSESVKIRPTIL
jgi:hypothetical protein